jgi:DNA-directed RNA polymerase specialized sigma24 family protein
MRDVLLLAATGEHTFEEIAELLGIPVGTVKWRASEGRRLLRERLANLEAGRA